jgi:hypothetical protein
MTKEKKKIFAIIKAEKAFLFSPIHEILVMVAVVFISYAANQKQNGTKHKKKTMFKKQTQKPEKCINQMCARKITQKNNK